MESSARCAAVGLNVLVTPEPTQPADGNEGPPQTTGPSQEIAPPTVSFAASQAVGVVEPGPRPVSDVDWWVVTVGNNPGVYRGK